MATIILRNLNHHLRYANCCLSQCRSPMPYSPLSEMTSHGVLPLLQLVVPPDVGIQSLAIYQRYLFCSSTATVNPDNQASKSSGHADSGNERRSGGSHESSDAGKPVRGGPVSWLSLLLLVATGAGVIFYYDKQKKQHIEARSLSRCLNGNVCLELVTSSFVTAKVNMCSTLETGRDSNPIGSRALMTKQGHEINNASKAVKEGPSVGKAAIGGPFNLINHDGKHVTEKDFLGKWTLMYFGFTHCPDICPDELQKLASAVDKIKEKTGIEIVPVFISVDPERDNVEQVGDYVKEFHPRLIGLTGSPDEIRNVARAYRVYYMKTAEEGSDYLVDHSIVMYVLSFLPSLMPEFLTY
ncbi:hypothetical protein CJ030_MR2G006765 [Morella rubra]|uniref:Thioredoxin domain-containing protein n=1 Tax=Morella rubra TaxID=262757 RepID=A0A6A1WGN8_9ROSI|nr:hypothetical protein CJ030_MR2G006765 [Morella rubra]